MTNFPPLHACFPVFCSPFLSLYLLCFPHSESPLSVLSPLLCSRGLYFTVPWVLLSDSTADPEAARKSYSALYQTLCCLAFAIRRVLTPGSLMTTISPAKHRPAPPVAHCIRNTPVKNFLAVCVYVLMHTGVWECIVNLLQVSYKKPTLCMLYLWPWRVRWEIQRAFLYVWPCTCVYNFFFILAGISLGSCSIRGEIQWYER